MGLKNLLERGKEYIQRQIELEKEAGRDYRIIQGSVIKATSTHFLNSRKNIDSYMGYVIQTEDGLEYAALRVDQKFPDSIVIPEQPAMPDLEDQVEIWINKDPRGTIEINIIKESPEGYSEPVTKKINFHEVLKYKILE